MSLAILTFSLPDEATEFEAATHAMDYRAMVWDFDRWLRDRIKHGPKTTLQDVRDELYAQANAHRVEIEP